MCLALILSSVNYRIWASLRRSVHAMFFSITVSATDSRVFAFKMPENKDGSGQHGLQEQYIVQRQRTRQSRYLCLFVFMRYDSHGYGFRLRLGQWEHIKLTRHTHKDDDVLKETRFTERGDKLVWVAQFSIHYSLALTLGQCSVISRNCTFSRKSATSPRLYTFYEISTA